MYDILTIGTGSRDVFLKSKLFKVLKDSKHLKKIGFPTGEAECFALGSKIDVNEPVLTTGGGATNAAVTFSRQGLKTGTILSLGDDVSGKEVVTDLKKDKIKTIVSISKKHKTAYSTLLLTPSGERTILVYRGASNDLNDKKLNFKNLKTKWVYIVPSAIDFNVILRLAKKFKKSGAKLAINPSSHYLKLGAKKLKPLLKLMDVVVLNRSEVAALVKEDFKNEKKIFQKFDRLIEKGIAVMTEGPKGVLVSDGEKIYQAGIFKEQRLEDRTGAGDSFGSGFVAGLVNAKGDLEYAIRLASANATSVVEYIGAKYGILTKRQFEGPRFKKLTIKTKKL